MRAIDLNLLAVFDAMVEHRSVTRAAEAMGLSQPAMSAAVSRLRRLFDDPLFVRTGLEMQPTPIALQLAAPVRRVMDTVQTDILQHSEFTPAQTERTFTIAMPDIGEVHFVPALLEGMAREAPRAQLRTIAKPQLAAAEALESGEAQLAVGYFPDLQRAGFFQQKLFDNPHVCLVRRDHPTIGDRLTRRQYMAASHAVVRPDGREHVFEQFLQQHGIQRRVKVELSHFMSLLTLIERSDLIATVPHDLADICCRHANLHMLDVPLKAPVVQVHQSWHRRFHKDPANMWLRRLVLDVAGVCDRPTVRVKEVVP